MSENLTRIHLENSREGMPLSISGAAMTTAPATAETENTEVAVAEAESAQV